MKRPLLLALLLAAACGRPLAGPTLARMDVGLSLDSDGSLQVEERMVLEPGGSPLTAFRRRAPAWHHDGVLEIAATMDGRPVEPGDGPGQVRVGRGPDLDVVWTFDPLPAGPHEFGLSYRALNAVGRSGIRGSISWLLLPARRDFDVRDVGVTLTLPETAVLLEDPWVEEPGWSVARQVHGMTASRAGVPPGEGATIGIEFAADALDAPTPRWQRDEELGQQLVPAFVAGALFILVVAAGVVWMVRLKFPRWRVPPDAGTGTAVEGVTPAMHLAIARGRCRGDRAEARAAIDGLAAAGILRVDGDRIELSGTRTTGVSHEQILVEALARCGRAGARRGALESWRLRRRLRRALAADLVAGGWAATERVQAARDLTRAGVVVIVFGLGTWVAASIGLRQYGAWPLAVPCSLVISGLILAAAGQRFEILSATGAAARVLYFARVLDGRTKA